MKILSGVLTALVLVVAGLAGGSPAVAGETPYPHSIKTVCKSVPKPGVITVKDFPRGRFNIRVVGTVPYTPKTKVQVKAIKTVSKKVTNKVIWKVTKRYRGKAVIWTFPKLPRGAYTLRFQTKFGSTSVFKNCHSRFLIKVNR